MVLADLGFVAVASLMLATVVIPAVISAAAVVPSAAVVPAAMMSVVVSSAGGAGPGGPSGLACRPYPASWLSASVSWPAWRLLKHVAAAPQQAALHRLSQLYPLQP